jgi:hypothetical protein
MGRWNPRLEFDKLSACCLDFRAFGQLSGVADVRLNMKRVTFIFVGLAMALLAFKFWRHKPSLPVTTPQLKMVTVNLEQVAKRDYATRLREIIARANSSGNKAAFGKTLIVYDNPSVNAPLFWPHGSRYLN